MRNVGGVDRCDEGCPDRGCGTRCPVRRASLRPGRGKINRKREASAGRSRARDRRPKARRRAHDSPAGFKAAASPRARTRACPRSAPSTKPVQHDFPPAAGSHLASTRRVGTNHPSSTGPRSAARIPANWSGLVTLTDRLALSPARWAAEACKRTCPVDEFRRKFGCDEVAERNPTSDCARWLSGAEPRGADAHAAMTASGSFDEAPTERIPIRLAFVRVHCGDYRQGHHA